MKRIILLSDSHHTIDEEFSPILKNVMKSGIRFGDIGKIEVTDTLKKFWQL